ncbi:Release factor glutamine methyltransferase [Micromonospora sp. MH33]|uniref:methyltransferase domain-containing protein n=1 Tax=Micromonospora sp. MH33 TaxID=1945509 RepID=UPI000D14A1C5|nr:class I SAM-dependent methyltransferase [Micromonospora sp. MH33]PSK61940.1 Release factor glutamine methyltransferase [Micromonospora sp. MH33]
MSTSSLAASNLVERHRAVDSPTTFRLLDLEWDLLPGVFAPHLTQSAALYAEWLPYPVGGSFCEIGSGTGYLSVLAALRGCAAVTATDISPVAVDNTRRNAARHGVADRLSVHQGDLFTPIPAGERFDVIFWNSNFVDTDQPAPDGDHLHHALFDQGYRAHEGYLAGARERLHPGGQLLLGFTDLGNADRLAELADRHGWRVRVQRAVRCAAPQGDLHYQLLRLESR